MFCRLMMRFVEQDRPMGQAPPIGAIYRKYSIKAFPSSS